MADVVICEFNPVANFTALNAATANVAAATVGWNGIAALDFDKANHASIKTAGVYVQTTEVLAKVASWLTPNDYIYIVADPNDVTDIASVSVVLGESSTNYLTWTFDDSLWTADRWNVLTERLGNATPTGLGCNFRKIRYIEVYATFDAAANTLADFHVAQVGLVPAAEV